MSHWTCHLKISFDSDLSSQALKRVLFLHEIIRMDHWSTYLSHSQIKNKIIKKPIEKLVHHLVNEIIFSRIYKRKIKEAFQSTCYAKSISHYSLNSSLLKIYHSFFKSLYIYIYICIYIYIYIYNMPINHTEAATAGIL